MIQEVSPHGSVRLRNTFINFIRKEKSTVVSEDWVFDGFAKDDVNDYDIRQAVQSLPFPEENCAFGGCTVTPIRNLRKRMVFLWER